MQDPLHRHGPRAGVAAGAALLLGAGLLVPAGAAAAALLAAAGEGDATHVGSLVLRFDAARPPQRGPWNSTLKVELGTIVFQGEREHPRHDVTALNVAPLLRWRLGRGTVRPVAEVGAGVTWLSRTLINGNRYFTTRFQFTELAGVGLELGARGRYEIGCRIEHMSNGGIREPNDGITFFTTHVAWRFH
jgi:hypothetical protein